MSARAVRIYPTWWLFAGLMAIALWLTRGVPWDATRVEYWGMSGVDHLWRSFLLLPQAHHPVLGVGWSLVHEIYFYIVFAVFIWVIPVKQRSLALWIWTGLVLFGGLWGFAEEFAQTWTALVFYPMTLEFCAGGLIAYLIRARVTRFAYASFAIGSLGFLTVFLGGEHYLLARLEVDLDIAHVWWRTLTYGVCAVLIVYGAAASEVRAKRALPIPRSLVRLGDWSYALYLCHPLVISVIGRTCYRSLGLEGPVAALGVLTLSFVASLALAGLVYTMFERPLIAHFKHWQSGRRTLITAPAAE